MAARADRFDGELLRTTVDVEGTGLGVVIVRHCVRRHGGSVDFESALGSGTTFTVHMPAPHAA